MSDAKRIAESLLKIGAVKLSTNPPFTWTSGIKAPIYCDNRMIYSHPEVRDFVVSELVKMIQSLGTSPQFIAGTATAAIGWAALVADRLKLPFVYVRTPSQVKAHGTKKLIEGDLKHGSHVVVVEDLISTAKSSAATVESLRGEGQCQVTDIVSIFSYQMLSALEKARALKVRFHPLATISTLLDLAVSSGSITHAQAEIVEDFSKDPEHWGEKHGF